MEENVVEILLKLADLMESDCPNDQIFLSTVRRKLIVDALCSYAENIDSEISEMESDRTHKMVQHDLTEIRRQLIADALRCYAEEITSQEKADASQRPQ